MDEDRGYIELVKQARLGDRESLDNLAGLVRGRLFAYVYRITLDEELGQDIVQETMLEMFKVLGNLERADRFWPWLRGIAFNIMRRHHIEQQRHRQVPISKIKEPQAGPEDDQGGLAKLVSEEVKQIVFTSMAELKPRHRKVLAMRCYEQMQYGEIAELMGCSELGVRVLFCRAKRALQKALSRKGFGKGFLITALVLFGKMTAPSKTAAAQVSVTAAGTKVGVVAALLATAGTKTVVVSLTTAAVLAVGSAVVTSESGEKMAAPRGNVPPSSYAAGPVAPATGTAGECWYYFPEGADGPVMMRMMRSESRQRQFYCAWRQDEQANYSFNKRKNTIYINNWRMWRPDLAVRRLPTDRSQLREFLSLVEGRREQMEYVSGHGEGLLVVTGSNADGKHSRIVRHNYVLDEEYFRYDWPAGVKTVDNRDPMHKRGWTYFAVAGRINGQRISGAGRMPFVYAASQNYSPWLRIKVGGRLRIIDGSSEALVFDDTGKVAASYARGTFFKGLARPWMGLHTIDSVRRDAAEMQLWFETEYKPEEKKAEVVLTYKQDKLTYAIDMENDVIDKITFWESDGEQGELRFSYLQDISKAGSEFTEPQISRYYGSKRRASPGMLWLIKLIPDN